MDNGLIEEKIQKMKTLLNMWKMRNLSIKGKITMLRSKALPVLLYTAAILYMTDEEINKVDKLFYDFIWPSGKHHVMKNVLIQSIEQGGLKMPDFASMVKAIKLSWLQRLSAKDSTFSKIASSVTSIRNITTFLKI